MKLKNLITLGILMSFGAASLAGCDKKQDAGKQTGTAVDTAVNKTSEAAVVVADKTTEAAKTTAKATKNAAVTTADKTGEVLKQTESAVTQK